MLRLNCGYQPYAWGKEAKNSMVASLLASSGTEVDSTKRYAELWIGTHPNMPSRLGDGTTLLADKLKADATALLGEKHVSDFGSDVPFLLKVLSIDKALSIQAHPDKARAEVLHAKDPQHYPDPNHKPELVVALTDYEALCCFRPIKEIAANLEAITPLKSIIKNSEAIIAAAATAEHEDPNQKVLLSAALESLYSAEAAHIEASIDAHLAAIAAKGDNATPEDVVFRRVSSQFPGDVGCWMVYVLNLVKLKPGDGLFLAPNEPHSYLAGDSVEIMAASDNVVRAGLTPKFKDVGTLLEMLTYRTDSLNGVHFVSDGSPVQTYAPPADFREFQLTAVRVNGSVEPSVQAGPFSSIQLAVVTGGAGTFNGEPIKQGDIFSIPVQTGCTFAAEVDASLTVFLGGTNSTSVKANL